MTADSAALVCLETLPLSPFPPDLTIQPFSPSPIPPIIILTSSPIISIPHLPNLFHPSSHHPDFSKLGAGGAGGMPDMSGLGAGGVGGDDDDEDDDGDADDMPGLEDEGDDTAGKTEAAGKEATGADSEAPLTSEAKGKGKIEEVE